MPGAVILTIAGVVLCVVGAALLGWVIDLVVARRRCEWERAAVPRFRVIDGGNKTDLRSLVRRSKTTPMRAGRSA